jgi:hypothetical protein
LTISPKKIIKISRKQQAYVPGGGGGAFPFFLLQPQGDTKELEEGSCSN